MKHLKLFIIAVATLLAAGCTKEYITENNLSTTIYTIQPKHWSRNEGENNPGAWNYLYCTVDNKDITSEVMDKGAVQAFIYYTYDASSNLSAWTTLPFVYPLELTVYNDETHQDELVIVPENIRFEYELGKVTFIMQDLDGYDPEDISNSMSIKVCVGL